MLQVGWGLKSVGNYVLCFMYFVRMKQTHQCNSKDEWGSGGILSLVPLIFEAWLCLFFPWLAEISKKFLFLSRFELPLSMKSVLTNAKYIKDIPF